MVAAYLCVECCALCMLLVTLCGYVYGVLCSLCVTCNALRLCVECCALCVLLVMLCGCTCGMLCSLRVACNALWLCVWNVALSVCCVQCFGAFSFSANRGWHAQAPVLSM